MPIPAKTVIALASVVLSLAAMVRNPAAAESFKGLKYSPAPATGTWAVVDRDGANRQVPRYLSSLGAGETGTGVIASPSFRIAADRIVFSICGHDGQSGKQNKNYVALVDTRKRQVLEKTPAPGNDAMQERSWDVSKLKGREVRIELHDGDSGGAFAWFGVGKIDAGDALRIDFQNGLPKDWVTKVQPTRERPEVLSGGVPFLRHMTQYSLVPTTGTREIACGFAARRIFFLGGTVADGRPLDVAGAIDIVYRDGSRDSIPLMVGYTLDLAGKMLSHSKAIHLHASSDPFQHYLVIVPRSEPIETIVLRPSAERAAQPRITAITFQTDAASENLEALPDVTLGDKEQAWIQSHAITAGSPDMKQITEEIRQANKLP